MSEINELAAALAKAQGAFVNPARNRTVKVKTKAGPEYTFTYATLDAIMDIVRQPLSENGLSITHAIAETDKGPVCITKLLHSSGQSIECPVPLIVAEDANAQGWGSGLTYSKRYGLCAILAITADEDDDGNAACGNAAEQLPRRGASKPPAKAAFGGKPPEQKHEKTFSWSTATSAERRDYTINRIHDIGKIADPVQANERLKDIMAKLTSMQKDLDPADRDAVIGTALKMEQDIQAECSSGQ